MKTSSVPRRTLLRGAGVSLALPLMESLLPRSSYAVEQASRAPRLATVAVPFGVIIDQFHPKTYGRDYELTPTLQPMAEVKSDFTVFSNLDHGVRGGHAAHHALWSGVLNTERAGFPDGNITVDQRAAEVIGHNTRFPSLLFWTGKNSFTRTGVSVPAISNPSDAFKLMFMDSTPEQRQFERQSLKASGSILDTVMEDAKTYRIKLGHEDKQKLEEYFTSIRETEKKLELAEGWIDKPKPAVPDPKLKKVGEGMRDEKVGRQFGRNLDGPHVHRLADGFDPCCVDGGG